jgi:Arc/MetJ-type ribon-helix-helix transcriptional regulator
MKTVKVELTDMLANELGEVTRRGWFKTEEDAIRFAIMEFLESRKPALTESFQREDIAWALSQRKAQQ